MYIESHTNKLVDTAILLNNTCGVEYKLIVLILSIGWKSGAKYLSCEMANGRSMMQHSRYVVVRGGGGLNLNCMLHAYNCFDIDLKLLRKFPRLLIFIPWRQQQQR